MQYRLAGLSACLFLFAGSALAAPVTNSITFSATNQSMWGPGPAASIDITKYLFNFDPPARSASLGGIVDFGGRWGRYGAEIGLGIDVAMALGAQLSFTSGDVDVTYPMSVRVVYPDSNTVKAGRPFTIYSSWTPQAGAALNTQSPSGTLRAFLDFDVEASLNAEACFKGCKSGSLSFDFSGSQDLWSVSSADNLPFEYGLYGYISLPTVNTSLTQQWKGNLKSRGSDTFLSVSGDLTSVLDALGYPVNADFEAGGLSLEAGLAKIEAVLTMDYSQRFHLTATPWMNLVSNCGTFNVPVGTPITCIMPAGGFSGTPTFTLAATLERVDVMGARFSLPMQFLYAGLDYKGVFDMNIGPAFSWNPGWIAGPWSIYSNSWTLDGFSGIPGSAVTVSPKISNPEPASLLTGGCGLLALGLLRRRSRARRQST